MIKKSNLNILRKYHKLCHDFASVDFYHMSYLTTRLHSLRYNFYSKFCYLEFIITYVFEIKK